MFPCPHCRTKHTRFCCPKLHFIPIQQHVINKYLRAYQIGTNPRNRLPRPPRHTPPSLLHFHRLQDLQIEPKCLRDRDLKETMRRNNTRRLAEDLKRQRMRADSHNEQSVAKFQLFFMEHTTEVIKEQLAKLLGAEQYEDEIWNLKLDKMRNYKGYFPADNSSNLKEKFNVDSRIEHMHDKFKSPEEVLEEKYIYSQKDRQSEVGLGMSRSHRHTKTLSSLDLSFLDPTHSFEA